MTRAFRSLRIKVFLMFIGSIITLYLLNLGLINYVGKDELTNIYIDKVSAVNNRWNDDLIGEFKDEVQL
jgi:hypothetical protein